MIATPACLVEAAFATTSDTTVYTAPTSTTTIIDKATATNIDASSQTITVNIIPAGGSVGSSNIIIKAFSISAGETADLTEIKNQILNTGDQLSIKSGSNSVVVFRASGRQCV